MNAGIFGVFLGAHILWLRNDQRGVRANLAYANLAYANLAYANLAYANLTGANLAYANLTGANLPNANLTGANLAYANLTGANLTNAKLTRANLTGANLTGANLTNAKLTRANLTDANLTRANLTRANRIIGPQRSDGFLFTFCLQSQKVHAGCRRFTLAEYVAHTNTYTDEKEKTETLAILNCLALLAIARED